MFQLRQSGPTGGDETAMHSVVFDGGNPGTIKEFIDDLLTGHKGDWGGIEIRSTMRPGISASCGYYSHGEMEHPIDPAILDKPIRSISASGGWSRMDYLIFI